MNTQVFRVSERSHREMRQKGRLHDPFFGLKGHDPRPTSVATEIVDTDWYEDDDIVSEIEDEDPNSPRVSLNSSGQRSVTTLSSYEEAQTPRSSRTREAYPFAFDAAKPVQGPRGPHLFRSSAASSNFLEFQEILSLSPITPKTARPIDGSGGDFRFPPLPQDPLPRSRTSPFQFTHEKLDPADLSAWAPEKVAQSMLNAGIELPVAEKFVENDINGAILITLKFEDLKELHIQSFGVRTQVWEEIHRLRDSKEQKEMPPRPDTPIEDEESKEVRRERRRIEKEENGGEADMPAAPQGQGQGQGGVKRSQSRRKPSHEDIISPLESVSIVGIEQMMPKPHHCSKGENCSKWRRQQRMIEAFKNDHPFVDMDKGGVIMVAGDPGNPATAPAINRPSSTEALRPMSDAVPSVVASSDVLGPGMPAFQYLQEAALRNLTTRDPQDNVRQFLDFQHQEPECASSEVPPTPPFEIYPDRAATIKAPHEGLRALPKLSIPGQLPQPRRQQSPQQSSSSSSHKRQSSYSSQPPPARPGSAQSFVPYRMDRGEALSPDLQTPVHNAPLYRFGTPFSEMDVPVMTAVPLGPVARDASQSVPPDMNYRAGPVIPRSQSRASRRPSFQVMAPVVEDAASTPSMASRRITPPKPLSLSPNRKISPAPATAPAQQQQQQPRAVPARSHQGPPPRARYPWSPAARPALTSSSTVNDVSAAAAAVVRDAEGITYQGPVKKRKTRMLRHEWHDQYATLRGTRLALHKDAASSVASSNNNNSSSSKTLEYIDIDDYAIACSSLSTTSRLNAAFRAMNISRSSSSNNKDNENVAAFSFQLIPQDFEGSSSSFGGKKSTTGLLRKRESSAIASTSASTSTSASASSSSSSRSGPTTLTTSRGNGGGSGSSSSSINIEGAVNGTGKTHHFAVRSRDERIDWMRELMLAKALRQKGEGFEISVNGNMI